METDAAVAAMEASSSCHLRAQCRAGQRSEIPCSTICFHDYDQFIELE